MDSVPSDSSSPLEHRETLPILIAGATGYVGGRLATRLLEAGYQLRCLARTPAKTHRYEWAEDVEVVRGDVLEPESLVNAMRGCSAAYYLVHSMGGAEDFSEAEARGARNFRDAAEKVELERIVYLGGIVGDDDEALSKHLASRKRVGEILASGRTPVTEFRAAVIIGSGSISFEMLRYLTEVLPVMTTPRWVSTRCQPIAIEDVLEYLVLALDDTTQTSHIVPIGGEDVLTYRDMMQIYADEAGLTRRVIVPVPVLSPGLSSHWVGLVTPLPAGIARPLVDSLSHEVIVEGNTADELFDHRPIGYRDAVRRALQNIADSQVTTRWSDAGFSPADAIPGDPEWAGGTVLSEQRTVDVEATPEDVYWAVSRIGGDAGYYVMNWAWALRGLVDQLVGGPGLRRGRRHPTELRSGESLDFWRVVDADPGHSLELQAEMRMPGRGWLHFSIAETPGGSILEQTAYFVPRGLFGRLYWYAMFPFHALLFGRMARAIAKMAEERFANTRDGTATPVTPSTEA